MTRDGSGATVDGQAGSDGGARRVDSRGPVSSGTCVVGVHVDDCCTHAVPVPLSRLSTDQCLLHWPPANVPQPCFDKRPPKCALVDCDYVPPPSRLAGPLPGGAGCAFVDECQKPADCVMAIDARHCCACPQAVPAALLKVNPCIVSLETSAFPPPGCKDACINKGETCGACPPVDRSQLACARSGTDTLRRCYAGTPPPGGGPEI
ncbi:MAG: hypothetical protein IT371_07955 [Deltaproteobacteria bacterium]|nr:hypothetical protein [Deltaproteobacteria bacterium]